MIQDIHPHVYANAYAPRRPEADDWALCFAERNVLLARGANGDIRFPRFSELNILGNKLYEDYTYLFSIDGQRFYLIEEKFEGTLESFAWEDIMAFRASQPQYLAFAGVTGYQLHNWYKNRRFCGHCGQKLRKDQKERMLFCDECHTVEYPKISPAIIVAVTHGNRLLMSKYANREYKRYALLAGFAEIGETIEETVKREVMEEVGLKVKNLRYYNSQPWSFTDTLLLGFFAELDGDEEICLDKEELALAEWFDRDHIPPVESLISLTSEMIEKFRRDGFPRD